MTNITLTSKEIDQALKGNKICFKLPIRGVDPKCSGLMWLKGKLQMTWDYKDAGQGRGLIEICNIKPPYKVGQLVWIKEKEANTLTRMGLTITDIDFIHEGDKYYWVIGFDI